VSTFPNLDRRSYTRVARDPSTDTEAVFMGVLSPEGSVGHCREFEAMAALRICDRAAGEVRIAAVDQETCGFLNDPIDEMPE
jgi:hypothetical protein